MSEQFTGEELRMMIRSLRELSLVTGDARSDAERLSTTMTPAEVREAIMRDDAVAALIAKSQRNLRRLTR